MLKLYSSTMSPFAKKVLLAANQTGWSDEIQLTDINVFEPSPEFQRLNPLMKIPVLVFENGESLIESSLICQYLNESTKSRKIIPSVPADRWRCLHFEAVASGVADASFIRRRDSLRPVEQQDVPGMERQKEKVRLGLGQLSEQPRRPLNQLLLDDLATLSTLGYLDFRFSHEPWRAEFPHVFAWFDELAMSLNLKFG